MNRIDLVNHFGSVTKVAELACGNVRHFSPKIGYRIPRHMAQSIADNSELEFRESDYNPKVVISDGVLYESRPDVNTTYMFSRVLRTDKGLYFNMFGHFIPVENVMKNGKDAFINAFKSYELFQKVESPN